ncbi:MAG: DUF3015 domain-containing protein [Halobacteriovoraceae bacterium]|nr:DUF3015 domain-containing protein [Halobacteriovoraceae bacterium]
MIGFKFPTRTILLLFVGSLFSLDSLPYNHRKCTLAYKDYYPFGMSTSTSGFMSSTGDCALIGSIKERKQQFLAYNLEHMANDISRGQGEYLTAYSQLLGCSPVGNKQLGKSLQDNFGLLFNTNSTSSPEKAYKKIEDLILDDPILNKSCKVNS